MLVPNCHLPPGNWYSCRLNSTALDAGEMFLRAEQTGLKEHGTSLLLSATTANTDRRRG